MMLLLTCYHLQLKPPLCRVHPLVESGLPLLLTKLPSAITGPDHDHPAQTAERDSIYYQQTVRADCKTIGGGSTIDYRRAETICKATCYDRLLQQNVLGKQHLSSQTPTAAISGHHGKTIFRLASNQHSGERNYRGPVLKRMICIMRFHFW